MFPAGLYLPTIYAHFIPRIVPSARPIPRTVLPFQTTCVKWPVPREKEAPPKLYPGSQTSLYLENNETKEREHKNRAKEKSAVITLIDCFGFTHHETHGGEYRSSLATLGVTIS